MTKEKTKNQRPLKPAVRPEREIIAALDIGSSKVCCFIAEVKNHGTIEVIGIGHQASRGVKSGTIIDIKAAETAVAHAVETAENMARDTLQGQPIKSVFVNVPGPHVTSRNLVTETKVAGHDVSDRDIKIARAEGYRIERPERDQLIHVIPRGYRLDHARGIQEPRGMVGETLGLDMTSVSALSTSLRNLSTIAAQNHLEVDGFCAGAYAAGLSSAVRDEMNLGCTVIDMGGGTTSLAVFHEGKLVFTAAVPVGGMHVTNDIARGLTTSIADAERIKTLFGSAQATIGDDLAVIDVPRVGEEDQGQPNHVSRSILTGIIQPRIEETFELVRAKLVDSGVNALAGRRVILTGGAAGLPGLPELGQMILDKKIRLGRPQHVKGLAEATGGPSFSTAAGLLIYAAEHTNEMPITHRENTFSFPMPFDSDVLKKVTHWLKENW